MVEDSLLAIAFFSLIALATNGYAYTKGFFVLRPFVSPPMPLRHVIAVFAIYLGTTFFLTRYFSFLLMQFFTTTPTAGFFITFQFFNILFMVALLILYCRTCAKGIFGTLWKTSTSPAYNWALGILTWTLAFPVVAALGQCLDLILYFFFKLESYEQVAVRYLKTTLQSPILTTVALLSILVLAPVIEEFLFRGTLQTYFKNKFGTKAAILLASICFAFFHYSPEQGLGNISLIPALFVFACFLGFLYERQRSLFAPIGLHMAFNLASSLRIIFAPESS